MINRIFLIIISSLSIYYSTKPASLLPVYPCTSSSLYPSASSPGTSGPSPSPSMLHNPYGYNNNNGAHSIAMGGFTINIGANQGITTFVKLIPILFLLSLYRKCESDPHFLKNCWAFVKHIFTSCKTAFKTFIFRVFYKNSNVNSFSTPANATKKLSSIFTDTVNSQIKDVQFLIDYTHDEGVAFNVSPPDAISKLQMSIENDEHKRNFMIQLQPNQTWSSPITIQIKIPFKKERQTLECIGPARFKIFHSNVPDSRNWYTLIGKEKAIVEMNQFCGDNLDVHSQDSAIFLQGKTKNLTTISTENGIIKHAKKFIASV